MRSIDVRKFLRINSSSAFREGLFEKFGSAVRSGLEEAGICVEGRCDDACCPGARLADAPCAEGRSTIFVACSGGPDSSALALALSQLIAPEADRVRLIHIDHGIQGNRHARSERRAVDRLSIRTGYPVLHVPVDFNRNEAQREANLEARARTARYEAFAELQRQYGAECVCTGHNLDDQAETVLMRLVQGATSAGLAAMRRRRELFGCTVVRPLLHIERSDIVRYLRAKRFRYHLDRTNRDRALLRNRFRITVMPPIRRARPKALTRIAETAATLGQESDALSYAAAILLPYATENETVTFDRRDFYSRPRAIRFEQLRAVASVLALPDKRIPRSFFEPLLGVNASRQSATLIAGYGMRVRVTPTQVVCEPLRVVRRDKTGYSMVLFRGRHSEPGGEVKRLSEFMAAGSSSHYAVRCAGTHPGSRTSGSAACLTAYGFPIVIREVVVGDWERFETSRAGFKRRLQRQPDAFAVVSDGAGVAGLIDLSRFGGPALQVAASRVKPADNAVCSTLSLERVPGTTIVSDPQGPDVSDPQGPDVSDPQGPDVSDPQGPDRRGSHE